ncbi:MAG: PAS domain S-box protein [Patescibacteria group bacterium]
MPQEEHLASIQCAKAIVDTLREPLLVVDGNLKALFANASFYAKFLISEEEITHRDIFSLEGGQWDAPEFKKLLHEALSQNKPFDNYEIRHDFPKIGTRVMLINARKLDDGNHPEAILVVIEDITEHRQAEHEMFLSEVRYRKLFETAKDGILLIDPETEKIIDANPFLLEMLASSLDDIVGKKIWEIGAMKDVTASKAMFDELQARGYVRYEDIPIKSKDGKEHEVEFVSNRYPIDGTEMIQCNIRDITDRKAAERKATIYLEGIEKLNRMMTGRELKMIELKKEIGELREKLISEK